MNIGVQLRDQILKDAGFWLRLEFQLSGELFKAQDKNYRRYWCDGFDPLEMTNTRRGAEIAGRVWMMAEGTRGQHPGFRFTLSVPQRILHRPSTPFVFEEISIDEGAKTLRLSIGC